MFIFRAKPTLLTLPVEIICCILNDLAVRDLLNCTLVNRCIRNIIQDSSQLQYCIELAKAQMGDASHLLPNVPSWRNRLGLLRQREDSWRHLRWSNRHTLTLPDSGSVYEFVGGVYANGKENDNRTAASISYLRLPSSTNQLLTSDDISSFDNVGYDVKDNMWVHSMEDMIVLDFTMDPSQDLLVLVALTPVNSKYIYEIHLRSLQHNTPHSKAGLPFLACLPRDADEDPPLEVLSAIRVQVSGNLLAFLVKEAHNDLGAQFSLWNWQTNPQNSCTMNKSHGIDDFSLLSQDTFLLVRPPGKIEVYKFRDPAINPNIPLPIACYEFPPLSDNFHYWYSSLSSNPSPYSTAKPDDIQLQTRAPMTTTIPLPPTTRLARHYDSVEGADEDASEPEEDSETPSPLCPQPSSEIPTPVSSSGIHEHQLYYPEANTRVQACCVYILSPHVAEIHQQIHSFVFFVNTSIFLDPPKEWFDAPPPVMNNPYMHPAWNFGGLSHPVPPQPAPNNGGGGMLPLPPVPFPPPQVCSHGHVHHLHMAQTPPWAMQAQQRAIEMMGDWEQQLVDKQRDELAMGPPGSGVGGASGSSHQIPLNSLNSQLQQAGLPASSSSLGGSADSSSRSGANPVDLWGSNGSGYSFPYTLSHHLPYPSLGPLPSSSNSVIPAPWVGPSFSMTAVPVTMPQPGTTSTTMPQAPSLSSAGLVPTLGHPVVVAVPAIPPVPVPAVTAPAHNHSPAESLAHFYQPPLRRRPPRMQAMWQLKKIPWDVWGPQNTRWFEESMSTDWQHAVYGMRAIGSIRASALIGSGGGKGDEKSEKGGGSPGGSNHDHQATATAPPSHAGISESSTASQTNDNPPTPHFHHPHDHEILLTDPNIEDYEWEWFESDSESTSSSSDHGPESGVLASLVPSVAAGARGSGDAEIVTNSTIVGGSGSVSGSAAALNGANGNGPSSSAGEENAGNGTGMNGNGSGNRRNAHSRRHLRLRDFKPYSIFHAKRMEEQRKTKDKGKGKGKGKGKEVVGSGDVTMDDGSSPITGRVRWHTPRVVEEPSTCKTKGAFRKEIVSSLPYVEVISEESFEVTDVMMDDCRVLLLKRGHAGRPRAIDVLVI